MKSKLLKLFIIILIVFSGLIFFSEFIRTDIDKTMHGIYFKLDNPLDFKESSINIKGTYVDKFLLPDRFFGTIEYDGILVNVDNVNLDFRSANMLADHDNTLGDFYLSKKFNTIILKKYQYNDDYNLAWNSQTGYVFIAPVCDISEAKKIFEENKYYKKFSNWLE